MNNPYAEVALASAAPPKSKILFKALLLVLTGLGLQYLLNSLSYQRGVAKLSKLHHNGPAARADELKGSGRIYLVRLGGSREPYSLEDFAQRLRSEYGLDVRVLPAMAVDSSALGQPRGTKQQYVAELLFNQIRRGHPDLAEDPEAYLIGFTDTDMYSADNEWVFSFTQRDHQRTAVISTYQLHDYLVLPWARVAPEVAADHLRARTWRVLLKDVGLLYWKLPLNNDPSSLLSQPLEPDIPAEVIYESDLDPARTRWGQYAGWPCIFLSYSTVEGIKPSDGPLLRACSDKMLSEQDESKEFFVVDLRLGLLLDKHTDFNLPDTVPIELQRVTRDGWSGRNAFGISGTHNYDEFLSSADNIRIDVVHADGGREGLVRVPRWQPILPLAKYVDTDYAGRHYEMRWANQAFEHYDLKRFDGAVKTFLPCSNSVLLCYLTGYRDGQGQELKFERDGERKLMRLTSPNHSWLHMAYGAGGKLAEIEDSRGRMVRYAYDERGRLTSVTYPSGEIYSYEYDSTQHLLTFSVARDAKAAPAVVLRNEYANGRLMKQTLADGLSYTFRYDTKAADPSRAVEVKTPEGKIFGIRITDSGSTVREFDSIESRDKGRAQGKT